MFRLENQLTKIVSATNVAEKHGKDRVAAISVGFYLVGPGDLLSYFDPTLRGTFYRKPQPAPGELPMEHDGLTELRFPFMRDFAWSRKYAGYLLRIHIGASGAEDVLLAECGLKDIRFTTQEGGSVGVHFTKFKDWPDAAIDLLVGGTPCQSFSVAGLRKGLADPRGNLMLTYLAIAERYSPRWLVWENVPGVLSSNGGRDFGTLLGGLAELGYGFAYRILDAQFFGVAQRRRRVFVVGHLGDWRRAAAVLFERESLLGHPAPRREAGQRIAATLTRGAESGGKGGYAGRRQEDDVNIVMAYGGNNTSGPIDVATAVNACASASGRMDFESETFIAHSLRGEGFDAIEDGTGRGTPLVPVHAFDARQSDVLQYGEITGSLDTDGTSIAVAFQSSQSGTRLAESHATLDANNGSRRHNGVMHGSSVRRLTPRECERLQGFPDDYTLINVRGKPAADGPRYKALGNSMAVPVMAWIGQRIQLIESHPMEKSA